MYPLIISRIFFIFLLFINFTFLGFGQNLIPNPSFEAWDGTSGGGGATLDGLDEWFNVNGTPDHHHVDLPGNNLTGLEPCPLGEGQTNCGYAHDGDAVLGCWKGNGLDGTREWAGAEMLEPMQAGACYKVSFWIQNKEDKPDFLFESNQWGMYFNTTPNTFFSANAANYDNHIDHMVMTEAVVDDTIWHYFEFDYMASEDFAYAYIGFMGNVSDATFTAAIPGTSVGFYVWFDEVSVTRIEPTLTLTEDMSICAGDSVLISADSNFPIIWESLNPDSLTSFWVTPTETTEYTVQTQDSTACSITETITITVSSNMIIDFPEYICENEIPIELKSFYDFSGTWSGNGIQNATTGLFSPEVAGQGITEINFESNVHCSESFILVIEVNESPIIDFSPNITAGCTPLEIEFTNLSTLNGIDYNWNLGNDNTSQEIETTTEAYTEIGNYDVSLVVVYSDYCKGEIVYEDLIQVVNPPLAGFSFSPSIITNTEPLIQFSNTSSVNASQFLWDFGDGNTSQKPNPNYEYAQAGIYDVRLIVSNAEGCLDSITHQLVKKNELNFHIPNVFSPNGDGYNDFFKVFSIGILEKYQLTIYNRWGGMVFQSNNLEEFWDGSQQSSQKKIEEGIYLYMIEYTFSDLGSSETLSRVESGDILVIK